MVLMMDVIRPLGKPRGVFIHDLDSTVYGPNNNAVTVLPALQRVCLLAPSSFPHFHSSQQTKCISVCLSHQDVHATNHILGSIARRTGTYRIPPLCRCLVQVLSRSVTSLVSTGWTLHHVRISALVITVHCNIVCPPLPSVEVYAMGITL